MSLWLALLAGSSGAELSAHFSPPVNRSWNLWTSGRERQQLEWQELTLPPGDDGSVTGLTGGLLRLGPNKELPTHYHPESFGETYYFTRGNGHVKLGEYTRHEVAVVVGSHFGVGEFTIHFRTCFGGGWDVHWGYDLDFDPWPGEACHLAGASCQYSCPHAAWH